MRSLLARVTPFDFELLTNREMVNFQKMDFFDFFFIHTKLDFLCFSH